MPSVYPGSLVPPSNEGWTHPESNFFLRVNGRRCIVSWIAQSFRYDETVCHWQTALGQNLGCIAKLVEIGNESLRKVEEETLVMMMSRMIRLMAE